MHIVTISGLNPAEFRKRKKSETETKSADAQVSLLAHPAILVPLLPRSDHRQIYCLKSPLTIGNILRIDLPSNYCYNRWNFCTNP